MNCNYTQYFEICDTCKRVRLKNSISYDPEKITNFEEASPEAETNASEIPKEKSRNVHSRNRRVSNCLVITENMLRLS